MVRSRFGLQLIVRWTWCGGALGLCVAVMDLEAAIVQRAATVRRLGQDIGFFEWVCWAHVAHANVHMTFGDNMVDLLSIFAPGLPELSDDAPTHFPIATLVGSTKRYSTSRYSTGEDDGMPQCSIAASFRSRVPL
jgi:hypothetical protein